MDPEEPIDAASSTRRKALALVLLGIGVCVFLVLDIKQAIEARRSGWMVLARSWGPMVLAAALAAMGPVRRGLWGLLNISRQPTPARRRTITIAIAILAAAYLAGSARWQGRDLSAKEQDESMYLIQSRMLASGRLWMPQHPCADFFESFHILVRPVYAPMYFPGTALAYVPAIWLGIAPWILSMLISGAAVGMTYRVLAELLDGLAGLLGAMLMLSSFTYRHFGTMVLSHPLMLLMALAMTWAALRWRREHGIGWAVVLGMLAGWAGITRPLDALCYAVPMLTAAIIEMRRISWGRRIATFAVVIAAAAPFLAMQIILDLGVTGEAFKTPVTMYHQHYWPHMQIGYRGEVANYRPPTALEQFGRYYESYITPSFVQHRNTPAWKLAAGVRGPLLLMVALPSLLLAGLMLPGVLELRTRWRWAFFMALPAFVVGYATFMFFRKHYGIVVFPVIIFGVLAGARAIERAAPRWREGWTTFVTLAIVAATLVNLPELNPAMRDPRRETDVLYAFNRAVRRVALPAIVLVRQHAGDSTWSQEPVYNTGVAWPDDAAVVRAHDLGERNVELFRYYAGIQPERTVYVFDKSSKKIRRLGNVKELAGAAR